ncbi:MAG: acyl-CoA thioesterase [Myxococcales bacterium]|nr:acyl-CoA thioesterase [Myxococcales bacterium]
MNLELEPDPHPAIRVSMMPADTNAHGTIFGGKILSLIDQAGAIGAHRIGVGRVVTVAMREVVFKHPVRVGDLVSCYAEVTEVGRTSVTVCVRVMAHRPTDVKRSVEVTRAEVVYVHIDDAGRPIPIVEND